MAKRLRTPVEQMTSSKVAVGGATVHFVRVGREWISDPISDEVADAVATHPHFSMYETDEEIQESEIDPMLVDFSNATEIERMLTGMPLDEIADMIDSPFFVGIVETLVRELDADQMRDVVRKEVDPVDLVKYIPNPVPAITRYIVDNGERLNQKRDAFLEEDRRRSEEPIAEGPDAILAGGITPGGELTSILDSGLLQGEPLNLTDEERAGLPRIEPLEPGAPIEYAVGTSKVNDADSESETTEDPAKVADAESDAVDAGAAETTESGDSTPSDDPLTEAVEAARRSRKK